MNQETTPKTEEKAGVGSSALFADWSFAKSAELVTALKEREDSWDELGHLALLIITALEEQTADRELEGIEDRAREAYRFVLRRGRMNSANV